MKLLSTYLGWRQMNKAALLCLLSLLACAPPAAAQDDYAQQVKRDVELIISVLAKGADEEARINIERVRVEVLNSSPLTHVLAYKDNAGHLRMIINTGTHIRLLELAQAMMLNARIVKDDDYLDGYTRYLAYADIFDADRFLPAGDFLTLYRGTTTFKEISALTEADQELAKRIYVNLLGFIIAHELAHHVLGHTSQPTSTPLDSRQRESAADKWALNITEKSGFSPLSGILVLLLYNENYGRTDKVASSSTHPAPLTRATEISGHFEAMIAKAGTEAHGDPNRLELLKRMSDTASFLILRQQERRFDNFERVQTSAHAGDRWAQLALGEAYDSKPRPGIKRNLDTAAYWYRLAAQQADRYDYLDAADADYRVGYLYGARPKTFDKTDFEIACKHMKRSAAKHYQLAIFTYSKFLDEQKCTKE